MFLVLNCIILLETLQKDIPENQIVMSLERRMKCGLGKCGHCQIEGVYVCQEGPVFPASSRSYDVSADGSKVLWITMVDGSSQGVPLSVVQNWPALLEPE